jgi:hypothetical protein
LMEKLAGFSRPERLLRAQGHETSKRAERSPYISERPMPLTATRSVPCCN